MMRKGLVVCVLALFATMAFARGGWDNRSGWHSRGGWGNHWHGGGRTHWNVGFSGFYWDWYVPPVYVPDVVYAPPVEYVPPVQYVVPAPTAGDVTPPSVAPNPGIVASEHSGIYVDYSGGDMIGSNFANSVSCAAPHDAGPGAGADAGPGSSGDQHLKH